MIDLKRARAKPILSHLEHPLSGSRRSAHDVDVGRFSAGLLLSGGSIEADMSAGTAYDLARTFRDDPSPSPTFSVVVIDSIVAPPLWDD
jgi:hypothetical protein